MPDGPEFRLDPLTREWVAIVGHRQRRPNLPAGEPEHCPFCVGGLEAPEPYEVRAFENRWPPFGPGRALDFDVDATVQTGTGFTALPARGAAEIVLYSAEHDASLASIGVGAARRVVDLWADRTSALLARPEIEYVLVFENRGAEVGATISHPHGQIYAFPFVPPVPRREAEVASRYGCPLCAELPREVASRTRVVFEDGAWVSWVPYASGYPFGVLVAPRAHVPGLPELDGTGRDGLAAALVDVLGRYDRLYDQPFPYLMWVHPGVHLHVHLAPPLRAPGVQRYVASGEVGSGTLSNPIGPDEAAARLRDA